MELASYGCSKSTCAASVIYWPSSAKVYHTRLPQCSVGHFILKQLLLIYACYYFVLLFCVLFLVEGNQDEVLLVILRDGSFNFRAVVGLSSLISQERLLVHIFQCLYILAFIAELPNACQPCLFTELVPV